MVIDSLSLKQLWCIKIIVTFITFYMATGIEITVQASRAIISLEIAAGTVGDLLLVFLFAPVFTRWTAHFISQFILCF